MSWDTVCPQNCILTRVYIYIYIYIYIYKVARGLGILCKIRRVLDKETLRNLYFSFIYSYLTNCVHIWGNSAKTYLAHLQKLQKKFVRIITFSKFNSHTQPLMYELKLLNIVKQY